jgi:N-alpha-acetyltransferase 30
MDKTSIAQLPGELRYVQYEHGLEEEYLPAIRSLISKDLSEPYSIYVYRYFLYQWGHLCFMVRGPFRSRTSPASSLTVL